MGIASTKDFIIQPYLMSTTLIKCIMRNELYFHMLIAHVHCMLNNTSFRTNKKNHEWSHTQKKYYELIWLQKI